MPIGQRVAMAMLAAVHMRSKINACCGTPVLHLTEMPVSRRLGAAGMLRSGRLKRVAIFQIRSLRFRSLLLRMSLSQNRCTLLRDMR